jgi:hypothetical protein
MVAHTAARIGSVGSELHALPSQPARAHRCRRFPSEEEKPVALPAASANRGAAMSGLATRSSRPLNAITDDDLHRTPVDLESFLERLQNRTVSN